jgi:hypothetical protein
MRILNNLGSALLGIMIAFLCVACNSGKLSKYESLVDGRDKAVIYYKPSGDSLIIQNQRLESFKRTLKRNIEPEDAIEAPWQQRIVLMKKSKVLATLDLTGIDGLPYVNVRSSDVNFNFRLTYGIGMAVENY